MANLLLNTRYMQYVSAITATLTMASVSTLMVWPSPTLPLLASKESPIGKRLSDEEGSWIVSILTISPLPFTLITGWLLDRFGRKTCLLFSAIPLAGAWIIILSSKCFAAICAARGLAGCGIAIATVGCSMYNAEVADSDIRGRLSISYILMMLIGSLIVLTVGPVVSYDTLAMVCLSIPLLFALIFVFMPESPYYLVKWGKREEAKKVLARLTPVCDSKNLIEEKINEIEKTIEADASNKSNFFELFSNKEHRRPLIVIAGVKLLQQFSGFVVIEPYGLSIVQATESSISPEVSAILFGVIQFPSVLFAAMYCDKIGRKPLLIISAAGCALSTAIEGLYFYMQDVVKADLSSFSWVPTTGLVMFLFLNTLGVTTLPVVLLGEIFATNIKGVAISAITLYTGLLGFLLAKFFQPLSNLIGIYCFFWFFSAVSIWGCFFVYFGVPETKKKTFVEIQQKLRRNVRKKSRKEIA